MSVGKIVFIFFVLSSQLPAQASFASLAKEASDAREANQLDKAEMLYGKALKERPAWAEGWFSLGTIQYDKNNYRSAQTSFEKAVKLDAKAGTARVMLGLCEFELGQDADALEQLQRGLNSGVANDEQLRNVAVFHLGLLLARAGKFEATLETLAPLCAEGVESEALLMTVGRAVLRMREETASSAVVQRTGHAECLGDRKQFDQARGEYQALVAEFPDFSNLHYAFGRFLLLMDHNPDGAVGEFKKEIANQPKSAVARLQIAAAEYRVDSTAGLPYAEEAVKLDPNLPLGHYLLGLLLVDTGEDERAVTELEMARKMLPREAGVYYALGTAYAHTGRKAQAAEVRAEFQKLKNEPAVVPPR